MPQVLYSKYLLLVNLHVPFVFDCVDGVDDRGHGVQHPPLWSKVVSLVLDEGLTNPDIDKDVDQGEKAQDEDESLKKIVGVKYVNNPASRII